MHKPFIVSISTLVKLFIQKTVQCMLFYLENHEGVEQIQYYLVLSSLSVNILCFPCSCLAKMKEFIRRHYQMIEVTMYLLLNYQEKVTFNFTVVE